MIEKVILYSIVGIAVSVALSFLTKSTGDKIDADEQGAFHLKMNKLYLIAGLGGLIMGLVFLILIPLIADNTTMVIVFIVLLILSIAWGTGIPCLMYYKNHRLTFDDLTITVTNVYGKQKQIKWEGINNMKFSPMSGLLTITNKTDEIKIHQHLVGLSSFIDSVEKKTNWTAEKLKLPIQK
tara:strand:- start:1436 stop:1978 length:543 start_codon:yes stop_codon:yes gene_type:complete